jgi:hypothetical protein
MAGETDPRYDPNYRNYPFMNYGGNAELPKFISQNNAPKEIEREFWGPTSKIVPLSNLTAEDLDKLNFHFKRIKIFSYSRMSRKDLSRFDERIFENLEIVFRGAESLGANGLLLERSSESRIVQQTETSNSKSSLKEMLFGRKENSGGQF